MKPILPPIYRDSRRLLIHTEEMVRRFSRYHKYTIGSDLRKNAMSIMRGVHRAVFDKAEQTKWINGLVWQIDDYKISLQMAMEIGAFRHATKGAVCINALSAFKMDGSTHEFFSFFRERLTLYSLFFGE